MNNSPLKVLYVCTHNRCRSILSEAITNHISQGRIVAKSAGSQPVGEVHPLSLKYLQQRDIATEGLQSQSWDEFADFAPDLVITVCDSAAGESCPLWMGNSIKVHWGLADPSKLQGNEAEIAAAFGDCINAITTRVQQMLDANLENLQSEDLRKAIYALGAE